MPFIYRKARLAVATTRRCGGRSAIGWLALSVFLLGGCQSETEKHLDAALKACDAGDHDACARVSLWEQKQLLDVQRRRARADALLGVAASMQAGATIGRSFTPPPSPVPVYAPPPSPAPQFSQPMNCTAMHFSGMPSTTISCE